MKIKKLTILAVAALVVGLMVPTSADAADCGGAVACACGDTVVADTTLAADLMCTTTPGLIIGANGVTLDLNGFTISSEGVFCGNCHGVRNGCAAATGCSPAKQGFNGVTIKNGTIIGFEQGIRAEGAISFKLQNLNITGQESSSAIDILNSKQVQIAHTTIFISKVDPDIEGIRLQSVDGVKVNTVHVDGGNVGVNFGCAPCPDPNGPTNGVIENSTFANNGNGIILFDTTKATVKWNVVTGSSGSGIIIGLGFIGGFGPVSNVELFGNTVDGSGGNGILLGDASASEVSGNTVTRNAGNGITLNKSTGNVLEENTASSNTGDGIDLNSTSTGNVLEENTANGNGAFGYDDATTGNTYQDNRCTLNTSGGSDPTGLCTPQS